MKLLSRSRVSILLLVILFVLAACNNLSAVIENTVDTGETAEISVVALPETTADPTTAPPQPLPTVDTEAIVAEVLASVNEQLAAQPTETPQVRATAPAQVSLDLQASLVEIYERANPSVVFIIVPQLGSGSGFVYNEDGYIVTNNHVVEGGFGFEVVFANGERREAELVGTDVDSDLAVLQVTDLPADAQPLPLAQPDSLQVGEFAVAIGNPFGEQGSMSLGIISALGRSLESQRDLGTASSYSLPEVVQTDAPINPGNSGGPLLNLNGEVIGVNSAIATTSGSNSGVGFSIPVQAVRQVVPSLIADGEYIYPYMGVGFDDEISLGEQAFYGLSQTQGTYVVNISPGSPADEAGLVAANPNNGRGGDLVIAIDGRAVNNFSDLNGYLVFNTTVGQTIDVTVLRDGEQVVLPLTLGARP